MDVSKQTAEDLLDQVQQVTARTRKSIAASSASTLLILWGVIWILGFLSTQFWPKYAGWAWLVLDGVGIAATLIIARSKTPVKSSMDRRISLFWLFLIIYGNIWLALLWPWNGNQIVAFGCTLIMFAYVVMGIFGDRFMLWLGLAVTALTLLGYFAFQEWLWVWMAAAGGGALAGTGLYIRYRWR